MNLNIHEGIDQGSDEWLELRRGLLTASTIGQLITPSTLKVAANDKSRALVANLVAERITGWTEPTYMNDDMMRGHDIEPVARDWYANKYGVEVKEVTFAVRTFDNGARLGYSPDGLVGDVGLIEVKAPRAKSHIQTHIAGEVPAHHMAQIQAGLLVTGREWLDFISYCAGLPPFVKRVHPDPDWQAAILDAALSFELRARVMEADYNAATDGLETTERLAYLDAEVVI